MIARAEISQIGWLFTSRSAIQWILTRFIYFGRSPPLLAAYRVQYAFRCNILLIRDTGLELEGWYKFARGRWIPVKVHFAPQSCTVRHLTQILLPFYIGMHFCFSVCLSFLSYMYKSGSPPCKKGLALLVQQWPMASPTKQWSEKGRRIFSSHLLCFLAKNLSRRSGWSLRQLLPSAAWSANEL